MYKIGLDAQKHRYLLCLEASNNFLEKVIHCTANYTLFQLSLSKGR